MLSGLLRSVSKAVAITWLAGQLVSPNTFASADISSPWIYPEFYPASRSVASINNTGLTDEVGWDRYSFFIRGKRVFVEGGEFHGFRLPVVPLWKDVMQKAKAAGLNTISIYTHWAMINPKDGVVDLEGINDLQPLFDAARESGLWIIARPGPYINSETSAGGVPGHVLTLPGDTPWNLYNGILRSNQTVYHDAWQDYVDALAPIIAKNQITNGGPVIMVQLENEYYNGPGQNEYVIQLKDAFHRLGVVVPTMHNDPGMFMNLVDIPDIYAFDQYPLSFDCTNPTRWRDIATTFRSYHEAVMPNVPLMIPEYQGGAFAKRGTQTNEMCRQMTNPNSQRVLNHQMWASGSTAMSFYMFYGGTNWGQLPYPVAETSYDFAAPLFESRELSEKYYELKLQSMFLRSFPDIRMTDLKSEDNSSFPGVFTTHLTNPETGAEFYISRHTNISDWDTTNFSLNIDGVEVPQILPGRDSIITVVNVTFGNRSRLFYSTAPLFSHLVIDETDVLVAYGFNDTNYEMSLVFDSEPQVNVSGSVNPEMTYDDESKTLTLKFENQPGLTAVDLSLNESRTLVLIADYETVSRFWMPTLSGSGSELTEYVDLNATTPFLVSGPYLVRNATVDGNSLSLTGDLDNDTAITVFASSSITEIKWNSQTLSNLSALEWGAWSGVLIGPHISWSIPDLQSTEWRFADSLPEVTASFNDSSMVSADHTNTTSKFPPYYGGPWILYADDYGYHMGNLVWRGAFDHGDNHTAPSAVNISVSGGQNFAFSAWVNEHYLGPSFHLNSPTNNESFPINDSMLVNGTNIVTVLQDHMGHNLAGQIVCCTPGGRQRDLQQPKGIQGYYLEGRDNSDQFKGWKLAGNLDGEDFPDKTRKIFNEGGLYGERRGWHLPGFDDSQWDTRTPWEGLEKAGVGWFRSKISLNIPDGFDVPLAFVFPSDEGHYRAQLYVNGWQMGKRIANLGPQTSFPVHEGILNYQGENIIAISLWALGAEEQDLKIPSLKLVQTGAYTGGVGSFSVDSPGWSELRD